MTTYEQLLGQPVDVLHPTIKVFAVDDNEGLPIRQLAMTITPGEGSLELPRGRQGEPGPRGDPVAPYILKGDKSAAEITAMRLTAAEKGWAYRNTGTNGLHYWSGTGWVVISNAFGAAGPTGPAGALAAVTLTSKAAGTQPEATLTGPAGNQTLNIKIPKEPGPKGDTGPTATIGTASDYDATTAASTGSVLTKLANGKWGPQSGSGVRIYSIPEGSFEDTGNVHDAGRLVLANYPLDQVSYPTMLEVSGHFRGENGLPTAQLAIEVRVGHPDTGALIGKGLTIPGPSNDRLINVTNHYSSPTEQNRNTTPGANLGVVPANHQGTAGTVYVVAVRTSGLGAIRVKGTDAQLVIKRYPTS